ncbi:MAG: CIA30 family protein [Pseudomonadota bacterium]
MNAIVKPTEAPTMTTTMTMTEDLGPRDDAPWIIVNDTVMGGVSEATASVSGGVLAFRGFLSLANNGGFASTRTTSPRLAANLTGFAFDVRGDGRRYQFRLRPGRGFDGMAWRQYFETREEWSRVELQLGDFEPVFRGRQVPGAPALTGREIGQIGFMLADRTEGEFRLEVRGMTAVFDQGRTLTQN